MFTLVAALTFITIDEYAELCPPVDFSPRPAVCYEYEAVYLCDKPLDFGPNEKECIIIALCPTDVDFGPMPIECEEIE